MMEQTLRSWRKNLAQSFALWRAVEPPGFARNSANPILKVGTKLVLATV